MTPSEVYDKLRIYANRGALGAVTIKHLGLKSGNNFNGAGIKAATITGEFFLSFRAGGRGFIEFLDSKPYYRISGASLTGVKVSTGAAPGNTVIVGYTPGDTGPHFSHWFFKDVPGPEVTLAFIVISNNVFRNLFKNNGIPEDIWKKYGPEGIINGENPIDYSLKKKYSKDDDEGGGGGGGDSGGIITKDYYLSPDGGIIGLPFNGGDDPDTPFPVDITSDPDGGFVVTPISRDTPEPIPAGGPFSPISLGCTFCIEPNWSISSQDIPGVTVSISTTGLVTGEGIVPIGTPAGEHKIIVSAINSIGEGRFRLLKFYIQAYDIGNTWERLGSNAPEIIYKIHHHREGYYLLASNIAVYKTTDFETYTKVFETGSLGGHINVFFAPFIELSNGKVIISYSTYENFTNSTYKDVYIGISSDEYCTEFTSTRISAGSGNIQDTLLTSDELYCYVFHGASNRTRMKKVLLSNMSIIADVLSITSDSGKTLGSAYLAGESGNPDYERFIFTNRGTSGISGTDRLFSSINGGSTWTQTYTGTVANLQVNTRPIQGAFHRLSNNTIKVCSGVKILQSTDEGASWEVIATEQQNLLTRDINPEIPCICYAGDKVIVMVGAKVDKDFIYVSRDGGVTYDYSNKLIDNRPTTVYRNRMNQIIIATNKPGFVISRN